MRSYRTGFNDNPMVTDKFAGNFPRFPLAREFSPSKTTPRVLITTSQEYKGLGSDHLHLDPYIYTTWPLCF